MVAKNIFFIRPLWKLDYWKFILILQLNKDFVKKGKPKK